LSHHFSESSVSPNNVAMKEDPQDPPATLFVNRESREQTLKYYFIVWRTDAILPTKPYTEKPFCIYPSIDTVVSRHLLTFLQLNSNIATVHILRVDPSRYRGLYKSLHLVHTAVRLTSRRHYIVPYYRVSRRPLGIPAVPYPSPSSNIPSRLDSSPPKHSQGIHRNEESPCLCRLNLGRIHLPPRLPQVASLHTGPGYEPRNFQTLAECKVCQRGYPDCYGQIIQGACERLVGRDLDS
jgi:hypothetical protein